MSHEFKISYQLRNTYRVNGIIYSLKSIPIIKNLLPKELYANKNLKKFALVISTLSEIVSVFLWKVMYLLLMVWLPLSLLERTQAEYFVHIVLLLTLIGGILHSSMLSSSKDKYYAIILMRMDAKKYTLSNYSYFLLKTVIGFLPVLFLLGKQSGVGIITCIFICIYIVEVKITFAAYLLSIQLKVKSVWKGKLSTILVVLLVVICLCVTYIPVYLGYAVPVEILYMLCGIGVITSAVATKYITRYDRYREAYKSMFFEDGFIQTDVQSSGSITQQSLLNKLDLTTDQTSDKVGYAYFNDLFMKRHNRLLTRSAKRLSIIILICFIVALVAIAVSPNLKKDMNESILVVLPSFLIIMYFINRGKVITEAMFMNCDHSMLAYRFYRKPDVILHVFMVRLKTLIRINLIPASIIAVGLPLLLLLSGGTEDNWNYAVLFITIIAMSVFFSVHNMVLYYLLQPYNINIEMKNPTYSILNYITYFVCYTINGKRIPTVLFGTLVTGFSLVYIVVSLILAYRLAPKTFRLRQ